MIYLITTLHVIVCLFLIGVVLLQTGKRADLAGAFGGGGSQTVFGARGATTLLHKLTVIFFILFVLTSITLAILQMKPKKSLLADEPASVALPAPAAAEPVATPTAEPEAAAEVQSGAPAEAAPAESDTEQEETP